jgi:prepilin-type N-terminal cleavage/methylation domain-containing protein
MNNTCGFTLIEVILAMSVLTTTVFITSGLMLRSFLRVHENRDDIEKVFLIKNELYKNYFKPPKSTQPVVKKIEKPEITITSVIDDINEKSSLKDLRKNLKIVRSDAIWTKDEIIKESSMLSFVYVAEKKSFDRLRMSEK